MERIYIAVGGPLPGIPGTLSPGLYDIDWQRRTAMAIPPATESIAALAGSVEEETAPAQTGEPSRHSLMTNGG